MSKEQSKHQRNSVNVEDGSDRDELEQLGLKFSAFRRAHKPRMRIPEDLRAATISAIDKGIPEKSVLDMCRVSPEQLNRWREVQRGGGKVGKKAKARVFKVVDAPVGKKAPNRQKESPSAPVHLRIGEWEICLRQIER